MATNPMSLEQFGQTIKGAHPEYGDLSDTEVAGKVLQKYPQYNDMIHPAVPKAPVPAGLTGPTPTNIAGGVLAAGTGALNLGKGIVKGGLNTLRGIGNLETKIPGVKSLMPGDVQSYLGNEGKQATQPHGIMQNVGKGIEQAGEFMVPGGAEESIAAHAPALMRPAAKIGLSALSSGAINKAQGGSFGAGAAAGGIGAGIGQGLRAAAPLIAETGLGLPKAMRAFGKTPGKALLEETTGIRPETVAASAQGRLGELNPQLEAAADRASVRPNPARGLLTSGTQEIPLHNAPDVEGRLSQPVRLTSGRSRQCRPQLQGTVVKHSDRLPRGFKRNSLSV